MSEPWFDPHWAWLPGTLVGCLGGLWGGLAGWLVPRGRAKAVILGGYWLLLTAAAVMLLVGGIGYYTDQPYEVWYGLGLAGFVGVACLGGNGPMLVRAYRQAEERRIEAEDLG